MGYPDADITLISLGKLRESRIPRAEPTSQSIPVCNRTQPKQMRGLENITGKHYLTIDSRRPTIAFQLR